MNINLNIAKSHSAFRARILPILLTVLTALACQSEMNIKIKRADGPTGGGDTGNANGGHHSQDKTPAFSIENRTYTEGDLISITVKDPDVTIHYTIDGSTPTPDSPIYTGDIPLERSTTIKAIAVKDGEIVSDVIEAHVSVKAKPLTSAVTSGTYATAQHVDLTSGSSGGVIYYTLDGSEPTTSSNVYTTPIYINSTTTIKAIVVKPGLENSDVLTIDLTITQPAVAAPTFSLATGTYKGEQTGIILSTSTPGAVIHYTTDGSTPDTNDPQYSSALTVSQTTTIKAIAIASGYLDSSVTTASYTIKVEDVTSNVAAGTYATTQSVTLSTNTSGATIYYTLDGSVPTTSSTSGSVINVASTTRIRAIAVKSGLSNSDELDITITISAGGGTVETPEFSTLPGTYPAAITVDLNTDTAGASIFYTINGDDPITDGLAYSGPIAVSTTTTIKAYALKSGMTDSAVVTGTFTINSSTTWSGQQSFAADGGDADFPRELDVAMSNNGSAIAVWKERNAADYEIFMKEFASGAWDAGAPVPIPYSTNGTRPKVVMNDQGDAIITWVADHGSGDMLYMSYRFGGTWTHPTSLSDHISVAAPALSPNEVDDFDEKRASIANNGDVVVVWSQGTLPGERVIMKSERRNGSWQHPSNLSDKVNLTGTTDLMLPRVAMAPDGYTVLIYLGAGPTESGVFRHIYENGSWITPASADAVISDLGSPNMEKVLAVAVNSNHDALIAWGDNLTSPAIKSVSAVAGVWGTVQWHYEDTANNKPINSLSAAVAADGNVLLAWGTTDENTFPVLYQREKPISTWGDMPTNDYAQVGVWGVASTISSLRAFRTPGRGMLTWSIDFDDFRKDLVDTTWSSDFTLGRSALASPRASAMDGFGRAFWMYGEDNSPGNGLVYYDRYE